MKALIFLLILSLSSMTLANETHQCLYKDYKLIIKVDKNQLMSVEIFKSKIKISSCQLKIVFSEDGKNRASQTSLKRFEKSQCTNIYDKESRKVEIINKGFVKFDVNSKKSFAYIILNEQPLQCDLKQ